MLALAAGGEEPPYTAKTESWNGSNWTEVGDLNVARSTGASAGNYTDALIFSGNPTPSGNAAVESWNGSSWTNETNLNTGRREGGGAGTTSAALAFTGETPPGTKIASTEEWNKPSNVVKTLTD